MKLIKNFAGHNTYNIVDTINSLKFADYAHGTCVCYLYYEYPTNYVERVKKKIIDCSNRIVFEGRK